MINENKWILLGDDRIKFGAAFNNACREHAAYLSRGQGMADEQISKRAFELFELNRATETEVAKKYGKEIKDVPK